jgi:hypothetical protein
LRRLPSGLKTTEERSGLRVVCSACGNGGPGAIVVTPAKNLFHFFPSKAGGDQMGLVSQVKRGLDAWPVGTRYCNQYGTSYQYCTRQVPTLDYLETDHITVEAFGSQETAETLGIGCAPKGVMKGYVAIPIRLPTGELTGYIGITEAKLQKSFTLSKVVTFPQEHCLGSLIPRKCGFFLT